MTDLSKNTIKLPPVEDGFSVTITNHGIEPLIIESDGREILSLPQKSGSRLQKACRILQFNDLESLQEVIRAEAYASTLSAKGMIRLQPFFGREGG